MVHTLLPPLTAILQIPTMQQFDLTISATKVRQKVEHLQLPFAFSVIGVLIPWIGVILPLIIVKSPIVLAYLLKNMYLCRRKGECINDIETKYP